MDKERSTRLSRRVLLKQLAALGLLGPAGIVGLIQEALAKGDMPAIPGINTLQGTATVNGREAKIGTPVRPGGTASSRARPAKVKVPVGTIGIRGTGMYIETEETRTYFCLCYGEAAVDGKNMATRIVKTTHHESPLFLYESGDSMQVEAGPFRNHSDAELIMLEALCGREPPFMGKTYPAQRY